MKKMLVIFMAILFIAVIFGLPQAAKAQNGPPPKMTCQRCKDLYAKCLTMATKAFCEPLFNDCKRKHCKADGETDLDELLGGTLAGVDTTEEPKSLWETLFGEDWFPSFDISPLQ